MPTQFPMYPSVNVALKQTRDSMFRGNTFGQIGAYHQFSDADRERAARFDVAEAIRIAEEQRRKAGLK